MKAFIVTLATVATFANGTDLSTNDVAERLQQMGMAPSEEVPTPRRRSDTITTCGGHRCKSQYYYIGSTYTGCTYAEFSEGYYHRSWCKVEGGGGWITDAWDYCDNCTDCEDGCLRDLHNRSWPAIGQYCDSYPVACGGCDKCVEWNKRKQSGRRLDELDLPEDAF